MRRFAPILFAGLALAGCAQYERVKGFVVEKDAELRTKCNYLADRSGAIHWARVGAAIFVPGASSLLEQGLTAAKTYCSSEPITDLRSAKANVEAIIEAVRPVADQVRARQ